jgi:ATP-dependent helicase HepA
VKIVVFSGFASAADEIYQRARAETGPDVVALYRNGMAKEEVEASVRRFADDPACSMIICDRCAEEGRNFQFADVIIHFDLPLSPSRVEQRIGRVDRIGRVRHLRTRVLLGPDVVTSVFAAWYELLADGLGVFRESIAGLQFYVERRAAELIEALFRNGAAGLRGEIEAVQIEIEDEQQRVNEQYALDEIDARNDEAQEFIGSLLRFDEDHAGIQKDMERWVVDALKMDKRGDSAMMGAFEYRPRAATLIPHDFLLQRLGDHLSRRGTYRRTTAARCPGVVLYRVGEAFVDTMAEYVRWDDRGQAFAIWRVKHGLPSEPGAEWVGFRFDYVVSADVTASSSVLDRLAPAGADRSALRRRTDAFLPPRLETVYVAVNGDEVTDPFLLTVLRQSFRRPQDHGRDYNLTKDRLSLIDTVIPSALWEPTCRRVRTASEDILKARLGRCEARDTIVARVERTLESRLDRLRMRVDIGAPVTADLELETALGEAFLLGVRQPAIRLDSVGLFVLSDFNPFE